MCECPTFYCTSGWRIHNAICGGITCATMFPAQVQTRGVSHLFYISPPCSSIIINQPDSVFPSCYVGALEKEGITCGRTAYIEDKLFRQRVSLQDVSCQQ